MIAATPAVDTAALLLTLTLGVSMIAGGLAQQEARDGVAPICFGCLATIYALWQLVPMLLGFFAGKRRR